MLTYNRCVEDRTVYTLNNYTARHGKEKNLAGSKLNLKKWQKSEHKRARRMC